MRSKKYPDPVSYPAQTSESGWGAECLRLHFVAQHMCVENIQMTKQVIKPWALWDAVLHAKKGM